MWCHNRSFSFIIECVCRVDDESARFLTILKLVDAEMGKLNLIYPVLVALLVLETSDAKDCFVRVPDQFICQIDRNELFVHNGLDLFLRDAEALYTRFFDKHAKNTVLVDRQGQVKTLGNGTICL